SALFDPKIVVPAIGSAFVKLNPRSLMKNPVMFVLEIVTALTTVILIRDLVTGGEQIGFEFPIVLWLWFTVLSANFAEAVGGGRGRGQGGGGGAAAPAHRDASQAADGTRRPRRPQIGLQHEPQGGRRGAGRGRRYHSIGRRGDRGHRLGERSGDHRRVGAGH